MDDLCVAVHESTSLCLSWFLQLTLSSLISQIQHNNVHTACVTLYRLWKYFFFSMQSLCIYLMPKHNWSCDFSGLQGICETVSYWDANTNAKLAWEMRGDWDNGSSVKQHDYSLYFLFLLRFPRASLSLELLRRHSCCRENNIHLCPRSFSFKTRWMEERKYRGRMGARGDA